MNSTTQTIFYEVVPNADPKTPGNFHIRCIADRDYAKSEALAPRRYQCFDTVADAAGALAAAESNARRMTEWIAEKDAELRARGVPRYTEIAMQELEFDPETKLVTQVG